MTDDDSRTALDRRRLLAVAASGAAALAGCSGGGSGTATQGGDGPDGGGASSDGASGDGGSRTGSPDSDSSGSGQAGAQSGGTTTAGEPGYVGDSGSLPGWIADPSRDNADRANPGPGTSGQRRWLKPSGTSEWWSGEAVVVDGVTYFASRSRVAAYEPDGSKRWEQPLDLPQEIGLGEPREIPLFVDGTLVVATPSRVIGYDPADGSRTYLNSVLSEANDARPEGVHDGHVLYLVQREEVRLTWCDPVEGTVVRESDPIATAINDVRRPVIGDGRYYFGDQAVSLSDGSVAWTTESRRYTGTQLYSNGVLVRSRSRAGNAVQAVYAHDADSGEQVWSEQPADDAWRAFAADDERVYARTESKVVAHDLESGEQVWEQITASGIRSGLAVGGSNLYLGTSDAMMHVLDTESGERAARYDVGDPVTGGITVVGTRLYCNATGPGGDLVVLVVGPGE